MSFGGNHFASIHRDVLEANPEDEGSKSRLIEEIRFTSFYCHLLLLLLSLHRMSHLLLLLLLLLLFKVAGQSKRK